MTDKRNYKVELRTTLQKYKDDIYKKIDELGKGEEFERLKKDVDKLGKVCSKLAEETGTNRGDMEDYVDIIIDVFKEEKKK